MPVLAALLTTLFGGIFAQIATIMGTRAAVATAAIAAVSVLTVALVAAMSALVGTILPALPGGSYLALAAYLFVPPSAPAALAACFTCDAACALYRWKVDNVKLIGGR